jgi:hypothetical protein
MKPVTLRLVALVAPAALALVMGLAGCGEEHRSHGDRDRGPEMREGSDRDRHEDRHDADRHEDRREDDRH